MILGSVKEGDFTSEIQAPILIYYCRLIERAFDTNYVDEVINNSLDVTAQKQDGTSSKEFKQGEFVFVNVTFMNVWKEEVKDVIIIARVTDPDLTPVLIGIPIQTIGASEKGKTLLGFTLEQNAIIGLTFKGLRFGMHGQKTQDGLRYLSQDKTYSK